MVHLGWWVSLGPVTRSQSERCPREPGWVLLEGLESLIVQRGEEGRAGQGVGPLCWEVVLLQAIHSHLLEYCLICILSGKGAVCIILEPLVPNLVQIAQYYFPFCDTFFPSRNGLRVCIRREQDGAAGPRQPDRRGPKSRAGTTLPARP